MRHFIPQKMASSSIPKPMEDEKPRNWSDLPPELTSSILVRLCVEDILENAQKVCSSWRRVCKDPSMWQKIRFKNRGTNIMCRHAVERSQGRLLEIDITDFATDSLLNYIADRASNLRSLRLVRCSDVSNEGFSEAVVKLPLLEDLEITFCEIFGEPLKVVGKSCPNLKTLKLNYNSYRSEELNDDAIAIAINMPELRHLQLIGNKLTNNGLIAILDCCPHLEHLDLRRCFKINLFGDLEKRCFERIKDLRCPYDSTADYQYHAILPVPEYDTDTDNYDDDVSIESDEYAYHFFAHVRRRF